MNVESVIIPQHVEDKLESKHNVTRRQVEQVLLPSRVFALRKKGMSAAKICIAPLGEQMVDGILWFFLS